ncbi:MAG: hypothetical protein E7474_08150 [Ruminococcaceae bacterium]|nr:hypothetical protein [Oscillospiraceae bacterium]
MKFNIQITVEEDKGCKPVMIAPVIEDDELHVGEVVDFQLTTGEKAQFMVQRVDEDGYLCMLVDCLPKAYSMNKENTNKGGYAESDLRKLLKGEILDLFPADLRELMLPFSNGDLLRLPTEKEIFGKNEYGADEPESVNDNFCFAVKALSSVRRGQVVDTHFNILLSTKLK